MIDLANMVGGWAAGLRLLTDISDTSVLLFEMTMI